jgi:hypothetical protein
MRYAKWRQKKSTYIVNQVKTPEKKKKKTKAIRVTCRLTVIHLHWHCYADGSVSPWPVKCFEASSLQLTTVKVFNYQDSENERTQRTDFGGAERGAAV